MMECGAVPGRCRQVGVLNSERVMKLGCGIKGGRCCYGLWSGWSEGSGEKVVNGDSGTCLCVGDGCAVQLLHPPCGLPLCWSHTYRCAAGPVCTVSPFHCE